MVCQGWRCIISRQQDVLQKQKGKHKRLAWLFWVAFGIIILITLLLAALVFWIIWTQNFTTATSIVGLIASILGIMSGPPILLFTITKWPKRQFAPTFPVTPPEEPLPSQLPAEQPHTSEVWNIPYHRNPFFTGREQLLTVLHENLTASKAAILTQPQAISGLGGIGKTQTAVEYAYRYKQEYRSILWASAASRNTLLLDFVAIANVLELPEYQAQDQNITVAAVKRWLATHERWLLILANADELEVINDFLPTGASGHILITTRSQATGTMAHAIKVQEMDQQEGMLLLLRRAKVLASDAPLHQAPEEDQAKAGDIVTAMDGLPLALDQAGAYIEETGCTGASYLEQYQQRQFNLLKRHGNPSTEHREPVATTWSLSFDKIEHLNPVAADLLRFCAFLSPDAIPLEMIAAGASHLGSSLRPIAKDFSLLDEPLAVLRRYSLVRRNPDDNTISMHRLVQAIVKASIKSKTQRQWAKRTIRGVNEAFLSMDMEMWPQCKRYLPHALACAALINHYALASSEAAQLLNQAGSYLRDHAFYEQAEPLYQQALAIRQKTLGPDHPDTATSLNNLALLYRYQSKYEQAEPLYQQALAIRQKTLGPDHPNTITIQENYTALLEQRKQEGKGQH